MSPTDVVPDELPAEFETDARAPKRRRRRLRLSFLPTALTLGNLVCGVLALAYLGDAQAHWAVGDGALASGRLELAGWLVLLGMVFDAFDGRVARMTDSTSEFGGALDSLADVVTFGVVPALTAKVIMEGALNFSHPRMTFLTAAFFAVCACLRLARYNAEHDEPKDGVNEFHGLPTPGAAAVIAGAAIVHHESLAFLEPGVTMRLAASYAIGFGVLTGLGLLMVSRVPYAHVANKLFTGRRPVGRVALLLLVIMLLATFHFASVLAVLFVLYAASGPLMVIPRLLRGRPSEELPELFD